MSSRTHFDVLGLERDADAADVRRAFKQKVLQCHPDKLSVAASPAEREASRLEFHRVKTAAQVLADPVARAQYVAGLVGQLVDSVGRVSDVVDLSEFEASPEDEGPRVLECRCGGEYVIFAPPTRTASVFAECESCSLVIEVRLGTGGE